MLVLDLHLTFRPTQVERPRVCAVSYLNTAPLVWGALYGPQRGSVDLSFAVPAICADRVLEGGADAGLIPVIEMDRHNLDRVSGIGIASRGPARSILLVSQVPFDKIRTLAADSGSRTSVQLARIILNRRYDCDPHVVTMDPDLVQMLDCADAALLIGDAALALDPTEIDAPCLDLGEEWAALTGRPMVFAVWAGRPGNITPQLEEALRESCRYGLGELDAIIKEEAERRGFPEHVVHHYLTRHICYQLGDEEEAGLKLFLEYARQLDNGPSEPLVLSEKKPHDDAERSRRALPK
jgi:chorismate dehydratase